MKRPNKSMPAEIPDNQPQHLPVPEPPRLHWAWVLVLTIVTLGVFTYAWLIVQALWAQKTKPTSSKAVPLSFGLLGIYVIDLVVRFASQIIHRGAPGLLFALLAAFVGLTFFVLYIIATFTLRSELQQQPIGLPLGPVMTFFFSSIYFQYHLMRYGLEPEEDSGELTGLSTSTLSLSGPNAPATDNAPFASLSEQSASAPKVVLRTTRFGELEEHELVQLLDDMDDERARARRRESFYISTLVWLAVAWFVFYGPHVLWHQPHMVNPADVLKNRQMTYLDMPPDALKLKPKTPPKELSEKDHTAQSPKPMLDKKTLQQLRSMEPPTPPSPTPQQMQEQAALPPSPQPQPPPLRPQPQQDSMLDAPKPQQQQPHPTFTQPSQSAGENLKQLSQNALPTQRGLRPSYGQGPLPRHQGLQSPLEVLSDTTGVDPDALQKYLNRLLYQLRETWIPLLPEETYPPLSKQGLTMISFTLSPDGHIVAMQLDDSTHDDAINRAAWNGIKSTPYAPLPKGMKDPNLSLRIQFRVNQPGD